MQMNYRDLKQEDESMGGWQEGRTQKVHSKTSRVTTDDKVHAGERQLPLSGFSLWEM